MPYNVYRNGNLINSNAVSPYTNTGLTNGQSYTYQVSETNAVGEGPRTAPITITPYSTANPPLASPGELQALINAATSGTTVVVPFKRYIETATVNKALTLQGQGSYIDGQNSRQTWLNITNSNVNIEEFNCVDAAAGGFQQGGISAQNVNNVHLSRLHLIKGPGAGITMSNGTGHRITDVEAERCRASGFTGGFLYDFKIQSTNNLSWPARWHHNRTSSAADPLNEGGGIKTGNTGSNHEISGQEIDHNAGPGMWEDIDASTVLIHDNNVHHNTHSGIFFEISRSGRIYNNKVWENGFNITIDGTTYFYDNRGDGFGWPGAILSSSSKNIEVDNNLLAWNRVGLSVIYQPTRPPIGNPVAGGCQVPATQTYYHDNTVIGNTGRLLFTWAQDGTGGTLYTDPTNRGVSNDYFSLGGDVANFVYNYNQMMLFQFNATNGEEGGIYINSATKDSLLTAAGIPLNPEAGH